MTTIRRTLSHLLLVATLAVAASDAFAANQRSFVRSDGLDTDPCTLQKPCRSFNTAIGATNGGGEVVILDTAGYGPMTINKSIKIIGPSGVYGGISVVGGVGPPPPPTTGIVINAGDTDVVTLRGLDISGVPGPVGPFPNIGIDIQNAGAVHIEKSTISNFTRDLSPCIHLDTARAVQLYVVDSFLRECAVGILVNGTGPGNPERPFVEIDNTRIENGRNTVTGETGGLALVGNFVTELRNSIIAGTQDGIYVENTIATASARVHVIHSHITRTTNAAIEMTGGNNASLHVNVSNSVLSINANAVLLGHGLLRLMTNVISNNTNAIVNCGGNPANVSSLGYGSGIGSNLISEFTNITPPAGCTGFITPALITGS